MLLFEDVRIPQRRADGSGILSGIGPCMTVTWQINPGKSIDISFESIEDAPFLNVEISQEMPRRDAVGIGDQRGVDPSRDSRHTPPGHGDRYATGIAVDKGTDNITEEQAAVDEQGCRVPRQGGQPARGRRDRSG